jgi:transcriptional regulator with XRE-family HTH domain
MPESIHRSEYRLLVDLVRALRLKAGLTQTEVAERLGVTQSHVSDVERGSRRLDVIELGDLARICGTSLPDVVAELEARWTKKRIPHGTKGR